MASNNVITSTQIHKSIAAHDIFLNPDNAAVHSHDTYQTGVALVDRVTQLHTQQILDAQPFRSDDATQNNVPGGVGGGRFHNTGAIPVASRAQADAYMDEHPTFCTTIDGKIDQNKMRDVAYGRTDSTTAEIGVARRYMDDKVHDYDPANVATYTSPGAPSSAPSLVAGDYDGITSRIPGGPGGGRNMDVSQIPVASQDAATTYLNSHQFFGKKLTGDKQFTLDVAEGRVDATNEQISVAKAVAAKFDYFHPTPAAAPAPA